MKVVISGRLWSNAFLAFAIIALLGTAGPAIGSPNAADKELLDIYYEASPSHSLIRTPILKDSRQLGVKWVHVGVSWGQLEAEQRAPALTIW